MAAPREEKSTRWIFFGSSIFKDINKHTRKIDLVHYKSGGGILEISNEVRAHLTEESLDKLLEIGSLKNELRICVIAGSNDLLGKDNKPKERELKDVVEDAKTMLNDMIVILDKVKEKFENFKYKVIVSSLLPRRCREPEGNDKLHKFNVKVKSYVGTLIKKEKNVQFVNHDENFLLRNNQPEKSLYKDTTHLSREGINRILENFMYYEETKLDTGSVNADSQEKELFIKIKCNPWTTWEDLYEVFQKEVTEPGFITDIYKSGSHFVIGFRNEESYNAVIKKKIQVKGYVCSIVNISEDFPKVRKIKIYQVPKKITDEDIIEALDVEGLSASIISRDKHKDTEIHNGEINIEIEVTDKKIPSLIKINNFLSPIAVVDEPKDNAVGPRQKPRTTKINDTKPKQPRQCYICMGKLGEHIPIMCPKAKECWNCGLKSHLARNCRGAQYNKPKNREEKISQGNETFHTAPSTPANTKEIRLKVNSFMKKHPEMEKTSEWPKLGSQQGDIDIQEEDQDIMQDQGDSPPDPKPSTSQEL